MGFLDLRQLSRSALVLDLYLDRVRLDDVVDVMFCGLSSQITTHEAQRYGRRQEWEAQRNASQACLENKMSK
jgi:hypothetical protein